MLEQLNFVKQCRRYNLSVWQCPSFLFIIMGLIIIASVIGAYWIAITYQPTAEFAVFIALALAAILLVLGYFIIRGFSVLAEANQLKSEFISVASHQLRTPLTNIRWSLDLLFTSQNENLNTEQLESLRILKDNNQRMIDLVNDLLMSSRVATGELKLNKERVNLEKIVDKLLKEYQTLAQASNIELRKKTAKDISPVLADDKKIELTLRHLIDNGIRYGRGGWVEIRLSQDNDRVKCEVEDNGKGIAEEDQAKVFERFFRGRNVVKYQTQGTGLGLFIVKSIIHYLCGQVGFSSKEDKGSLFWFDLPIKKSNLKI